MVILLLIINSFIHFSKFHIVVTFPLGNLFFFITNLTRIAYIALLTEIMVRMTKFIFRTLLAWIKKNWKSSFSSESLLIYDLIDSLSFNNYFFHAISTVSIFTWCVFGFFWYLAFISSAEMLILTGGLWFHGLVCVYISH